MIGSTNFTTSNQMKMIEAFELAAREKVVVAVVDHHGSGFKFAVKKYMHSTSFTKIAFVEIEFGIHARNLTINLMKQFMNIKFVTKGYKKTEITKMIYDLGIQVKQNLKGKRVVLIFSNIERLNTEPRLSRFLRIIRSIPFKCGIILRTTLTHYEKIAKLDEKLFSEFMVMTEKRIVLERNTPMDIQKLCRAYGLKRPELVEEISKKTLSFTIAMLSITKFLKHSPVTQLELDLSDSL